MKIIKNEKIIKEIEKAIEEMERNIKFGRLQINPVEERIITPDQKLPHQFTGRYSWEI